MDKPVINQRFDWKDLSDIASYQKWRSSKLKDAENLQESAPIDVKNMSDLTDSERDELMLRCRKVNFACYRVEESETDSDGVNIALRKFSAAFGMRVAEDHRSAGQAGIVNLRESKSEGQRGYVPYTAKSMNWHTDGYYNAPEDYVSGFVLHCVRPAQSGGSNEILDPEIAYIRLRDENPDFISALVHPQAMSIPENREASGKVRPVSVGPVFYADPETGRLQMRYTARTRSIYWREDPLTNEAQSFLGEILGGPDPLSQRVTLGAGEGILNNNVLHNRTAFSDPTDQSPGRLICRVRFSNRVEGS